MLKALSFPNHGFLVAMTTISAINTNLQTSIYEVRENFIFILDTHTNQIIDY